MLSKVNIIYISALLIVLNGCNDNNQTNNSKKVKIEQNIENDNKEDKILQKIGISTNNDKIIIEPKKTKEFFDKLTKTLESEAKKFESKIDKIDEKDIGITANKDKITIDINKTTNFLKSFSKELESVAKDINKVVNE